MIFGLLASVLQAASARDFLKRGSPGSRAPGTPWDA